jgi:hypothetical protein
MKDISIMSFKSARKRINLESRKHCFEVFGYDFVLDEDFKPWLIEVNTNPCLEESSQILKEYLPRLIGKFLFLIIR